MNRIYGRVLIAFVFILLSGNVFAQMASIKGVVFDQVAKTPMEFASVSVFKSADSSLVNGTITDASGQFNFERLSPGDYYLEAQFMGYQSARSETLSLIAGQELKAGAIQLRPDQKFLEQVTVSGENIRSANKIDKQVYKADQFDAARGGTAVDVLRNMPSVAVDGQGEISVRGSTGFLVLLDGKPVQTDAQTILSQTPANSVENVEIITAPSAKYDADGKAGILNITTKRGTRDGIALMANVQGGLPSTRDYDNKEAQQRYGADLTLNYRKGKWDISASANYLRNDNAGFRVGDVYTLIADHKTQFPSAGERSFDKYNYGGRLNVGFSPSENDQLSAGIFASHKFQDRLADIYYNNVTTRTTDGSELSSVEYFNSNLQNKQGDFILGSLDYTHSFPGKSTLSLSLLYEHANLHGSTRNGNIEGVDTVQNTFSTYKNPLNGFRAKLDYGIPLGKGRLDAGYQYRRDDQDGEFVYRVQETGASSLEEVPEFSGNVKALNEIHAVYTQYSGSTERLEYIAGLRYEYATRDLNVASVDENDYYQDWNTLFPSASVLYSLKNNWKIKAGISRRVERTSNFELNPIPEREHSETLEQGDAHLLPEFIYLGEAGVIKTFNKGSFFSTVYYQDIENPIQRVNSVYADTILNRVYTNADKERRLGLELGIDYAPNGAIQLYLGGNIYKSTISGLVLDYADSRENSGWVHSINGNANFRLTPTLSVQGNINYLSERPTVQGEDSRFLSPNLSVKKSFLEGRLSAMLQWQNIDFGEFGSNRQRITTWGPDFYTTTNYIYETDVLMLNLSFNLNSADRKIKLPQSEFGEKEF